MTEEAREKVLVEGPGGRAEIDPRTPSVARMYDYYLGGKDNFAADRAAADELGKVAPSTWALAVNNRAFLRRAVRFIAEEGGIRQFLDHGSGLPTQDNVHQVVQRIDPTCRIVYVDNDPIVLAHGRALLATGDQTTVITADMRDPEAILNHPDVRRLIDLDQPVGVLFVSVLHCIVDDDDPAGVVKYVMDRVPSGSYLALTHLVSDDPEIRRHNTEFMREVTGGNWGRVRTTEEVAPWFDGLEIVEPGLVELSQWRPTPDITPQGTTEWIDWGGVGRKP